ncbi:MAG: four helix bundle protein [Verrucomicrobiota bacterium]
MSKIGDCLKEADETAYWLELLSEENIVFKTRIEPLLKEIDELIAILVTVSKHSRGD